MKDTPCIYLLEPTDPAIEKNSDLFLHLHREDAPTLDIDVPVSDVEAGNVAGIQHLLMAMQHYPQLIGKMLFSFNFRFTEVLNSQLYIPEMHWKTDPMYYKWFQKLIAIPFILFFIADEDARFYALAADILEEGEVDVVTDSRDGRVCITCTIEQTRLIEERLFNACCSLVLYCSGSGFNPKIYIEGVMALLNASFTYNDVEETSSELAREAELRFLKTEVMLHDVAL